ncbi:XRE family transcriptional regulator [Streptococcus pasteurianus]|uniref:XRE family transcriptional regulator n=1 Tax=Streptococcus gallolyticus TaxID=315405 RepID=UPI00208F3CC8|nr:XRE family transcriptional regulator [Streptococcus gallolyticus]MCO4473050.1 transcriptional regulator [Streptococcus infantarius subsp. infantarius]MCY7156225.1 XRE family transcriptional regulator [Streptococcus gallolyticus subsp. gallolyticus]
MNVGERIKQRRKSMKMSADQLAERVGVSRSTIFRYEKGDIEKVGPDVLKGIAKALNTTPSFLMGWDDIQESKSKDLEIISIYNELKTPRQKKVLTYADNQLKEQKLEESNQSNKVVQFPKLFRYRFFDQALSAGTGQYLNEVQVEQIELPIDVDADFVVPIYGDSMEPEYHSGDYVFVKLSVELSDGDIGVFEYYGDAYIKELVINDSGAYLHSLNPKYDDILIDADSDFRIIGEVVGRYREG